MEPRAKRYRTDHEGNDYSSYHRPYSRDPRYTVPCNFGNRCTRKNCTFLHAGETTQRMQLRAEHMDQLIEEHESQVCRLQDTISDLEREISSLKNDLIDTSNELKDTVLDRDRKKNCYELQITNLRGLAAQRQSEISRLKDVFSEEKKTMQSEIDRLRALIVQNNAEKAAVQEQNTEFRASIVINDIEKTVVQEEVTELKRLIVEKDAEKAALQEKVAELRAKNAAKEVSTPASSNRVLRSRR